MDSRQEFTSKVKILIERMAADKADPAAKKEMESLLSDVGELMSAMKEMSAAVSELNKEAKSITDSVAGKLAPVKQYLAELNAEYDKWRQKNSEDLENLLAQLQKASGEASHTAEWLKASIKKREQQVGGEDPSINQIIAILRKVRAGDIAKKLEGLRSDFEKHVDSQRAGSKQANHRLEIHLIDKEKLARKEAAAASKAADKAKVDLEKAKDQESADEQVAILEQAFEEASAKAKEQESAADAMADAAKALKKAAGLEAAAELDGDADHAMDILNTLAGQLSELVAEVMEVLAPVSEMAEAVGDMPAEAPDAPAEQPAEDPMEAPAPEMQQDEAPEEAPVEELELASAFLVEADGAAAADPKVEELKAKIGKVLGKITENRQKSAVCRELVQKISLKPYKPDPGEKVPKAPEDPKSREDKEHRLLEIKKEKEKAKAPKDKNYSSRRDELADQIEEKKSSLLELMEKHDEKIVKANESIEAKLVEIKDEEKKAIEKGHKQETQRMKTNADAFQMWAVQADKITGEENAALVKIIEHLRNGHMKTQKVLEVEKGKGLRPPEDVRDDVTKELVDRMKKKPQPKKTSLDNGLEKSADDEALSMLEDAAKDMDAAAAEAEGLDEMSESLMSESEALPAFEASLEAGSPDGAPEEEGPGMMDSLRDWLAPAPEMEMAPAAADIEDQWLREADVKQYPSEHDLSGGFWDLIEAEEEGHQKIVINKDLRSRITKKLKDMHKGAYKPGQVVCLDTGDRIVEASIKQYVGEGNYDVEAGGVIYRAPAKAIFTARKEIWG
jgi:hypothetical protein